MPSKFFIHAPNIHRGGGKALLIALLDIIPTDVQLCLVVDARMILPTVYPHRVRRVKPSIFGRIGAEIWLQREVGPEDTVLCFGNLPPLFKLRGAVIVFIQNRYLVDTRYLREFPYKTKLKMRAESLWLSKCLKNADEIIVQSPSMKNLLGSQAIGKPVKVLPFMVKHDKYCRERVSSTVPAAREFDFLYVASGEPHKNHRNLVLAWRHLAKEQIFPTLLLTLDQADWVALVNWINQESELYQLQITNMGNLKHEQVESIYDRARTLIYPSTLESFGIPLVEARQAGLQVVASELDFVRDVLDPDETFDPNSSISIARSVKRLMGISEQGLPLQDASGFAKYILRERNAN